MHVYNQPGNLCNLEGHYRPFFVSAARVMMGHCNLISNNSVIRVAAVSCIQT